MMQQLRSTQDKALHLVLEGEEVIFHYLGKYEDHKWYSMTIWGPSEGPSPIVGFQTLTEEEAIKKVLHHYYFNWNTISNMKMSPADRHGINLFFEGEVV